MKCRRCGIDLSQVLEYGQLGCAQCVEEFREHLGPRVALCQDGAAEHGQPMPDTVQLHLARRED